MRTSTAEEAGPHEDAIRFEDVSLRFSGAERPAIDRCSLRIRAREFVVILGPSGCGKTTLMKMVNRLYEPTSGRILLNGTDICSLPATKLRQQIGYVIQQTGLFPHMTVAQNVAVVPRLLGWTRSRIVARVAELLSLVELNAEEFGDRFPAQLSGGQQQRVGVARALAGDPAVLLMDEPFGALDAITRASLQDEILLLQQKLHKTIVFVSHDVEEALRLADRILLLKDGQVVQFDTPLNILPRPANDFVRELVGTDDTVRQLGLVRVETAMLTDEFLGDGLACDGISVDGHPTIPRNSSLREALSLLLRTGANALTVVDGDRPVGLLTLDRLRASANG
ncbi:MAG: ABC transporter ATP-binding protein, partial [Cyanobacteria bacterium P01_E01_bin.45]